MLKLLTLQTNNIHTMKIRTVKIPTDSMIATYLPVNYHDTFLCTINNTENISPDDIMVAFWTTMPKWLDILFKIRNLLVKPFGLQTGKRSTEELENAIRNGTEQGLMSVVEKSVNETIISLDDKHLKAYISVYIEEEKDKSIYITTLVKFHNMLGVIYFYAICPFHIMVVRNMFKSAMKNLLLSNKKEYEQT